MFIRLNRGGFLMIIILGCLALTELTTRSIFHDETYYQAHRWPIPAGLLLSSLVVWLCLTPRKRLIKVEQANWYISSSVDEPNFRTEEKSALSFLQIFRDQDFFFHISVRFWPWILIGLAAAFCFIPQLRSI